MTKIFETVKLMLEDQAPALAKELRARGELDQYVQDRAVEVTEAVVNGVGNARIDQKWDRLPMLELVGKMKAAEASLLETALSQIEFPQDG
jgi:hypothetical protein